MSLNILIVEDEPELEISHVPLSETENVEPDMELPHDFLKQDDLDLLQDAATALESIGCHAACEGMDLATARELETIVPGFMLRSGGHGVFTNQPSLEGLSDTIKTVKDKFVEIIQHLRKAVAEMYKRFSDWLVSKFSNKEAQDTKEEVNDFLNQTSERNGIEYIAKLPDDAAEAAEDIARFMDGDTKAFVATFTDKLNILIKRMSGLTETIGNNPTHYRLATGVVTVEQLFKESTDASVRQVIRQAFIAVGETMKARNSDDFYKAMAAITAISKEIDEIKEVTIASDGTDGQSDGAKEVPFDKLYDNIAAAADAMKKVSVQQLVAEMTADLNRITKISEETKLEEILEMMPEDMTAKSRHEFAQQIATFYRKIANLGSVILLLWKARAESVMSINKVGTELMSLKDSFEKAVVSAGASLTSEQKEQLVKALAGRGLKIEF